MKKLYQLSSCSLFIFLFLIPNVHFGQAPNLRSTSSFALFTAAGAFNNLGPTLVTGDIGTDVGALTGFPPGIVNGAIYYETDPVSAQAAIDVDLAYSELSGVPCVTVLGTTLGNDQILTPDVYCLGAASTLNGNLILDAQGDPNALFIFQINGAFSTSAFSSVILRNSAASCNVYWQVNGAFTLGNFSVFRGTVIANGAISLLEGSSLLGRGLSRQGAISTHNNMVTGCGGCAAPPFVIITETNVEVCGTIAATFNYTVENGPTTTFTSNGTGTLSLLSLPNGTSTFSYTPSAAEAATGAVVTITATIADPDGVGPCMESTDNATVTVRVPANAGTATTPAMVCDNSTTPIDLFSLLTGEQAGGTWTRTTGIGGTFDATAGTFIPAAGATSSTFTYTITGIAPCTNDVETVGININTSPDLAAIATYNNICPNATFDLVNLTITDNNNTTGTLSYYALQADAVAGTNPLASTTVIADGIFWIRKQTTEGCFDIVSVMVDIVFPCAPCPNPNGETINGGTAPITVCRGEEFTLAVDAATSINLPIGGTIDWYYDSDPGFTPGIEGTLLGASLITVGGTSIRNTCTDILAGEISFVSFQSVNPDIFSFVVLADLAAGVAINFTDNGWLSSGSFRTGEGTIIWTAPVGGVTAGTVITINGSPANPFTASVGTITTSAGLDLAVAGDQLISFCGTLASPTKILSAIQFSGATWDADASDANSSALPTGLTNGVNAVAVADQDNGRFECNGGTVSGTAASIASTINTAADWTTSATILTPAVATCTYDVTPSSTINVSALDASIADCGIFYIKGIVNPLPINCTAAEGSTLALQVEILCPEAVLSGDVVICQGQSATVTLTISGAPTSQNVTGNITNGTVDVNFAGTTDGDGNVVIQITGITQAGAYQIENILITTACPTIETSGTATVTVEQSPVVTIVTQDPVVCSSRRLILASLQAGILLDGQPFTGVWDVLEADSDGSFRDATDAVSTTFGTAVFFVPGSTDIARGYVTLILRSDDPDGPCAAAEASVRLTILRVNCGEFPWNGH